MMPSPFQSEFRPHTAEEPGILALTGRISYREAGQLRVALFEAISHGGENLLVDLAEVEAMDTAALAVLVEGMLATEGLGQELFLCTPSDSVQKIFHLAGLEGALAKCWGCIDSASRAIAD